MSLIEGILTSEIDWINEQINDLRIERIKRIDYDQAKERKTN